MFGINTLKRRNGEFTELQKENAILKSDNEAINMAANKVTASYQADMERMQARIDECEKEIERLTRKRDKYGRYIAK